MILEFTTPDGQDSIWLIKAWIAGWKRYRRPKMQKVSDHDINSVIRCDGEDVNVRETTDEIYTKYDEAN